MTITASRYHDFSCGHRVHGHENKCAQLHGHNYRVTFTLGRDNEQLDAIGRVLDFGIINTKLCQWLEKHWDHKFLAWRDDPLMSALVCALDGPEENTTQTQREAMTMMRDSIVWLPFNPTAENMAAFLLEWVGPDALHNTGAILLSVRIEETRKCSADASLS